MALNRPVPQFRSSPAAPIPTPSPIALSDTSKLAVSSLITNANNCRTAPHQVPFLQKVSRAALPLAFMKTSRTQLNTVLLRTPNTRTWRKARFTSKSVTPPSSHLNPPYFRLSPFCLSGSLSSQLATFISNQAHHFSPSRYAPKTTGIWVKEERCARLSFLFSLFRSSSSLNLYHFSRSYSLMLALQVSIPYSPTPNVKSTRLAPQRSFRSVNPLSTATSLAKNL